MRVASSISVELANGQWVRSEIQLEEVDFQRMLVELDIAPTMWVPTILVFQALEAEAQTMLMAQMIHRFATAMGSPENLAKMSEYKAQRDAVLTKIKASVGSKRESSDPVSSESA